MFIGRVWLVGTDGTVASSSTTPVTLASSRNPKLGCGSLSELVEGGGFFYLELLDLGMDTIHQVELV